MVNGKSKRFIKFITIIQVTARTGTVCTNRTLWTLSKVECEAAYIKALEYKL